MKERKIAEEVGLDDPVKPISSRNSGAILDCATIKDLAGFVKSTHENLGNVATRMESFRKQMVRFNAKTRVYDVTYMLEMEARHVELSKRFQLLIEKICVVSEIGYILRHRESLSDELRGRMLSACVWAMDLPDSWWSNPDNNNLTTPQWADKCFAAYRQAKLDRATIDYVSA